MQCRHQRPLRRPWEPSTSGRCTPALPRRLQAGAAASRRAQGGSAPNWSRRSRITVLFTANRAIAATSSWAAATPSPHDDHLYRRPGQSSQGKAERRRIQAKMLHDAGKALQRLLRVVAIDGLTAKRVQPQQQRCRVRITRRRWSVLQRLAPGAQRAGGVCGVRRRIEKAALAPVVEARQQRGRDRLRRIVVAQLAAGLHTSRHA